MAQIERKAERFRQEDADSRARAGEALERRRQILHERLTKRVVRAIDELKSRTRPRLRGEGDP